MRKLGAILIYLFILLYATDFQLWKIIDGKAFLLVVAGTLILTLAGCYKGIDIEGVREAAAFNAMVAAYLTAFIFLFSLHNTQYVLEPIVLALRPVLYGYIIQVVLKENPVKTGKSEEAASGRRTEISVEEAAGRIAEKAEQTTETPAKEAAGQTAEPAENAPEAGTQEATDGQALELLTDRENEIALLVKQGLSNKDIGKALYISETTVKKHLSNIFLKLEITNREQLKNKMK